MSAAREALAAASAKRYSPAMRWRSVLSFVSLVVLAAPAAAQIDSAPKVHARLIAEHQMLAPGSTITVAFEQDIRPGWHTYWLNPGEAGLSTTLDWTLPANWKAGAIQWPYPKRLSVGPLMNYGYEGKVWLLSDITVPSDAKPGDKVTLLAATSWLVCKEVCIPEDTKLTLPVTIGSVPSFTSGIESEFAAARARLPATSPWPMRFHANGALDLFVATPALARARPADAQFFPLRAGEIRDMAPQQLGFTESGLMLRLTAGVKAKGASALDGVLVLTSADGSVKALDVHAAPGPVPEAQFGENSGDMGWALALLLAFIGGLILNLMPCVLPILAMKAVAVASKAGAATGEAAREGLSYAAGAILSFLALGGAVIALRAVGQAVGWGFQLQSPVVVAGFALLIFAVGLNLSGVFEIPGFGAGDTLTRRSGAIGAFFTGVLAVAVAAPCTAPFMTAALGFALTQSAVVALSVFAVLGLGFAAPFIVLGLSPALLRLLPKPGAWMLRFRQVLAFPMYAAAVWLVWVLAQEAGPVGLAAMLSSLVLFAFAAWIWHATRHAMPRWRIAGAIIAVAALAGIVALLVPLNSSPATSTRSAEISGIPSEPYSAARLEQLRGQKRAIFINATAAWCITCLVNEKAAFTGTVRNAFTAHHVAYLVADWTNRNPEITALLEAHGRSGVPLYLYYVPGAADAQVLPQVLTESTILNAIGSQ